MRFCFGAPRLIAYVYPGASPLNLVARTGIEPVVSALRGRRVKPITLPGHARIVSLTSHNFECVLLVLQVLDVVAIEDAIRLMSTDALSRALADSFCGHI